MATASFFDSLNALETIVFLLAISGVVFVVYALTSKNFANPSGSVDPKIRLRKLAEDVARAESEFKREIDIQSQIEKKLNSAQGETFPNQAGNAQS